MTEVIIDAGTLTFSDEDLTATGLLVPYGVKCRSNLGEFTVDTGTFTLPSDVTGMSLNVEHKREDVVGAFTKVWEQPEGTLATFKYADTEEGRKAYEEGKSGKRKNLSAEVSGVRILDGKAIAGRLFAAAQVEKPAFDGATLLAAENTPEEDTLQSALKAIQAALAELQKPAAVEETTEVQDPSSGAPAEVIQNEENVVTNDTLEAGATVPATLLAGAPSVAKKAEEVDLGTVFASIHAVKNAPGQSADAETLLAALSDIKVEASGGLTVANSGVVQPAWVGKLWQGKRYNRRYLDLATHLYGGIQLGGRKGFKLDQGTALVQHWSGNKTELPSGTASTSVYGSTRQAYGYAADVAREWYDLDGGAEVIQAFFEGVVDSYAELTDEDALKAIFLAASRTSTALDRLVAPGTYPTDYPAAMGQLIQGIEAVSDAGDDASFAVVNPAAWNQLLFTPKDLVPEFVEFGVGIGTGEASTGKVRVVKAPQSFFTGTVSSAPQTIVGAKRAIEFREQGTTPIQIDALDIARGGIDKAVIGYMETFVVRPESLVLVGTKP